MKFSDITLLMMSRRCI